MRTMRIPAGLTFAMLIAVASLGAFVVIWNTVSDEHRGLALIVHVSALLCFVWSFCHYVLGEWTTSDKATAFHRDLDAVLTMTALITGLAVVITMLLALMTELLIRVLFLPIDFRGIWPTGLGDLGLVSLSAYLGFRHTRHPPLVTLVFWLLVMSGLWAVLQFIPPAVYKPVFGNIRQTIWTHWAGVFALVLGGLIALFVTIEGQAHRRWRYSAWPEDLERLLRPPPRWPGFGYSAGMLGVGVLLVGCVHVALPYTFIGAALAGVSMFVLAWRRWDANFADAGFGLMTLAGVSLFMFNSPRPPYVDASTLAQVFTRALIGLAIMTGVWYWLAGVWRQQLDNGVAWTTAGRMIHSAERTGYLCATITVLVCLHTAFWPKLPGPTGLDNSPARWAWGLGAHGLALLVLVFAVLKTKKATLGWLALIVLGSALSFTLIRNPAGAWGRLWVTHWPMNFAGLAVALTIACGLSARWTRWEPFHESLYHLGILILPMTALAGLTMQSRLHIPPDVPAGTFGLLSVNYLIAAFSPGPRKFLAPAILSALVGIIYMF